MNEKITEANRSCVDLIDEMNKDWKIVRPDLDPFPLEIVGRVLVLAQRLEARVTAVLSKHELSLGQFDILATLRRQKSAEGMTPSQIMKSVVLSSGGMTNRLDRLENAGLIARRDDPTDRRNVLVVLTEKGCERIDHATDDRFKEAHEALPPLSQEHLMQLAHMLRVWLLYWPDNRSNPEKA